MRKILPSTLILALLVLPLASMALPVSARPWRAIRVPTHGRAVILSSLNRLFPMGYYETYMALRLSQIGYATTFVTDGNVTLDFLVNRLNQYDIVILRTNIYYWNHIMYYYVGETVNATTQQKYSADFAQGWANGNAGILGVTAQFLSEHFTNGTLNHVKLMILISSESSNMGSILVNAGAMSVIYCNGFISIGYGLLDDLTSQLIDYLAAGLNVYNAVFNSVNYLNNQNGSNQNQLRSNIDDPYTPPFWFSGSSTLTINTT